MLPVARTEKCCHSHARAHARSPSGEDWPEYRELGPVLSCRRTQGVKARALVYRRAKSQPAVRLGGSPALSPTCAPSLSPACMPGALFLCSHWPSLSVCLCCCGRELGASAKMFAQRNILYFARHAGCRRSGRTGGGSGGRRDVDGARADSGRMRAEAVAPRGGSRRGRRRARGSAPMHRELAGRSCTRWSARAGHGGVHSAAQRREPTSVEPAVRAEQFFCGARCRARGCCPPRSAHTVRRRQPLRRDCARRR